ncbi:MAG TPA: hypothetical protein VFA45_14340 [Actinomycetes bacterium]|nr:hypothetical protein [Actinomycetes bacterium]
MSEVDEFLTTTLDRLIQAEKALLSGDLAPWLAMWSTQDPVTLFGVNATEHGADAVRRTFNWQTSWFTNCIAHSFELVTAGVSGDLAYTVAFEYASVSVGGGPVQPLTTRATHVYRREGASGRSSTATATSLRSIRVRRLGVDQPGGEGSQLALDTHDPNPGGRVGSYQLTRPQVAPTPGNGCDAIRPGSTSLMSVRHPSSCRLRDHGETRGKASEIRVWEEVDR